MNLFVLLILLSPFIAISQAVRSPVSAAYVGFGAYSNSNTDPFSIQANQACLARVQYSSACIYGEKRFLINELAFYNGAATLHTPSGNFGLDARYFGFPGYNEGQISLAYARSLGVKMDVGVQFNYYGVRIAGYGNASTINFDVGTILHLTDHLNTGLCVHNPVPGKFGKDGQERLASVYSAGIGFEPSEKFFFSIEVEKEENKPVNVKAGLQYKFLAQLMARFGISAATSTLYIGISLRWRSMRLDLIASYLPPFGMTPGILLLCDFHQEKN